MEKYRKLYDLGWIQEGQALTKYVHIGTGKNVAMKTLPLKSSNEIGVPIATLRKISLLKEINHPNVSSLVDLIYKETESRVDLALQYSDVHLRTFMSVDPTRATDRRFIRNVLQQILRGIHCYHSINVAHGNLNPFNVLIKDDSYDATITDLDMVIRPSYLAPEILHDSSNTVEINMSADVFSIGCIFAEMLMRKPLFDDPSKFHEIVAIFKLVGNIECYPSNSEEDEEESKEKPAVNNRLLSSMKKRKKDQITLNLERCIPDFRPSGIDLLSRMLRPNPRARISVEEALKHSYFKPGVRITAPATDHYINDDN